MTHDLNQFLTARAALREKLNLPAEQFDNQRIVGMLSDEIAQARQGGMSMPDIAGLLKQSGIDMPAEELEAAYHVTQRKKAQGGQA